MEEQENLNEESIASETTTVVDDEEAGHDAGHDEEAHELSRRGDVEKCPVCGSHVDSEAYYCPSCRNYFCFHCRARLVPPDTQLQCVNQQCDYYGKLVCEVCDVEQERDELPTVYMEPEDGYWPGLLLLALIGFAFLWYSYSLQIAAMSAIGVFVLGGLLLHWSGLNIFGKDRIVEHQRKSAFHSCIRCGEVVKEIRRAK